mmetsp:Transcript_19583/g.60542  ORF Transcript_19583/g.60542 Transcript_19583/m.60542 type:complete len:411 (+) Transcript_19583:627-1859(+)
MNERNFFLVVRACALRRSSLSFSDLLEGGRSTVLVAFLLENGAAAPPAAVVGDEGLEGEEGGVAVGPGDGDGVVAGVGDGDGLVVGREVVGGEVFRERKADGAATEGPEVARRDEGLVAAVADDDVGAVEGDVRLSFVVFQGLELCPDVLGEVVELGDGFGLVDGRRVLQKEQRRAGVAALGDVGRQFQIDEVVQTPHLGQLSLVAVAEGPPRRRQERREVLHEPCSRVARQGENPRLRLHELLRLRHRRFGTARLEPRHVLDDGDHGHVHRVEELDALDHIRKGQARGRGHDDGRVDRETLAERQLGVPGAGGRVHDEHIQRTPVDAVRELLHDAGHAAPAHHRRFVVQKAERHELQTELRKRFQKFRRALRRPHARVRQRSHQRRQRRPVHVHVAQTDFQSLRRPGTR